MNPLHDRWVDWLVTVWQGGFSHSYTLPRGVQWQCKSIREASDLYRWGGCDFLETQKFLDKLSTALISSIEKNNEQATYDLCMKVLKWGGVSNRTKKGERPTVKWMQQNLEDGTLCSAIRYGLNALHADKPALFDGRSLLMDSSATKIFSIADFDKKLIIYDGRVGAALGVLAKNFLRKEGLATVPPTFNYLWGGARSKNLNRDPSSAEYRFGRLWSGYNRNAEHARMVIQASQLISEVSFKTESSSRQWEAALFMIGYNV